MSCKTMVTTVNSLVSSRTVIYHTMFMCVIIHTHHSISNDTNSGKFPLINLDSLGKKIQVCSDKKMFNLRATPFNII